MLPDGTCRRLRVKLVVHAEGEGVESYMRKQLQEVLLPRASKAPAASKLPIYVWVNKSLSMQEAEDFANARDNELMQALEDKRQGS